MGQFYIAGDIEELLFDYSLDTYKPSATTPQDLCDEVIYFYELAEKRGDNSDSVSCIIDELLVVLRKDLVVKSLLTLDLGIIEKTLKGNNAKHAEKRVVVELLRSHIRLDTYKEKCKELLKLAISKPNEKKTIRSLTRSLVTCLIRIGYSPRYLYLIVIKNFYRNDKEISSLDAIDEFYSLIACKEQSYTAVLRVKTIFETIGLSNTTLENISKRPLNTPYRIESTLV